MKLAILLDVDGTLVDSNDLHAEAWQLTLAAHGFSEPLARIRSLIGMGGDKLLPALIGVAKESALGEQLSMERTELFMRDFVSRVEALPGARALVERILERGHRPVVASSANTRELEALLTRGKLADLLPVRTSSDEAEHSKPEPDIIEAALRKVQATAREARMLGDTPYDLEASIRAGVGFVGVRSGGYDAHALRGALAVYRDASELCEQFDRSPLAG